MRNLPVLILYLNGAHLQQLLRECEGELALRHQLLHGDVAAQPRVEAEGAQDTVGEDGGERLVVGQGGSGVGQVELVGGERLGAAVLLLLLEVVVAANLRMWLYEKGGLLDMCVL